MFCWQEASDLEDTQQGEESQSENQEAQDPLRDWTGSGQCLKARAVSLWCPLRISQHRSPPAAAI